METTLAPVVATDPDSVPDEALVAATWDGDDLALQALLERYRGFVRFKARSYFLAGGEREDVVQEGMIGLYKAVRDYDCDRGVSFRVFADLCVTRSIITAVKTATRRKHAPLNSYVSLHLPASNGEEPESAIIDTVVAPSDDPADSVVSRQELAVLREYFGEVLSPLEAEVLDRYLSGQTYAEIASAVGRHTKAIDNALQRIKRKVEAYLADRELEPAV